MINERIITHFLSYTTAQGCVKDLTSYFPGRIAVAMAKNPQQQAYEAEIGQFDEIEWVDDLTEIGGIALGTLAVLMPGFGPILTGGPGAGAVLGDVLGDYLETRMRQNRSEADPADGKDADGPYFVSVAVETEQEALLAERIMRAHQGAAPYRSNAGAPLATQPTLAETQATEEQKE